MQLDLTEEEARALADLLNTTVEGDTYQGSRCVRMFRTTLAKLVLMMRVLEEGKRVAAEAAGAAVAELDRQELERELRAVSTNGEFDRQALEPELQWCGLEGAAAAWERVDTRQRAERARLDLLRGQLPENPLNALSWASELSESAASWEAWEAVRSHGEGDGGRTWRALRAARADLRERRARSRDGRDHHARSGLIANCWRVVLDHVLGELDDIIGAHDSAVDALYRRAHRAGIA